MAAKQKDNDTRTNAQSSGLESRTYTGAPTWYVAPGSLDNEHFLIVAGHSVAKIRTSNKRTLALIAAAPDLLEACKAWEYARREGGISMVDWFNVAWEKTQSAIAKAEVQP